VSISDASLYHHPVLAFARDGANFSINTDDPTVTGTFLDDEVKLLQKWGLTESTLTRAVQSSLFLKESLSGSTIFSGV